MKKILLLSVIILTGITLSAQTKGDKYVSGLLTATCGSQTATVSTGAYSTSAKQPSDAGLEIGAEIGYFLTDKIKVAIDITLPITSSPTSQDGDKWLKDTSLGLEFRPSIAYYVKLVDNLYYAPEIEGAYGFGNYKSEISTSESYNLKYNGFGASFHFAAFDIRVNKKIGIGMSIGKINFTSLTISDKDSKQAAKLEQFGFNFNSASIKFKFYF